MSIPSVSSSESLERLPPELEPLYQEVENEKLHWLRKNSGRSLSSDNRAQLNAAIREVAQAILTAQKEMHKSGCSLQEISKMTHQHLQQLSQLGSAPDTSDYMAKREETLRSLDRATRCIETDDINWERALEKGSIVAGAATLGGVSALAGKFAQESQERGKINHITNTNQRMQTQPVVADRPTAASQVANSAQESAPAKHSATNANTNSSAAKNPNSAAKSGIGRKLGKGLGKGILHVGVHVVAHIVADLLAKKGMESFSEKKKTEPEKTGSTTEQHSKDNTTGELDDIPDALYEM